jgi:hypothetical protein
MNLKTPENYARFLKVWTGRHRWDTFGSFRGIKTKDKPRKGFYACPFDGEELTEVGRTDQYEARQNFAVLRYYANFKDLKKLKPEYKVDT